MSTETQINRAVARAAEAISAAIVRLANEIGTDDAQPPRTAAEAAVVTSLANTLVVIASGTFARR